MESESSFTQTIAIRVFGGISTAACNVGAYVQNRQELNKSSSSYGEWGPKGLNRIFLGLELIQIMTFLIGLLFYIQNANKCYLFMVWFEDGLCEFIMVILAIVINIELQTPFAAFLVGFGGVLSLGVAIYETYKIQTNEVSKVVAEEDEKELENIRRVSYCCCGGYWYLCCCMTLLTLLIMEGSGGEENFDELIKID